MLIALRTSKPDDVGSKTGVTFEHLAGIVIPVVGGMLWVTYGYRYAFLVGAAVSVICLLTVTRLPKDKLMVEVFPLASN